MSEINNQINQTDQVDSSADIQYFYQGSNYTGQMRLFGAVLKSLTDRKAVDKNTLAHFSKALPEIVALFSFRENFELTKNLAELLHSCNFMDDQRIINNYEFCVSACHQLNSVMAAFELKQHKHNKHLSQLEVDGVMAAFELKQHKHDDTNHNDMSKETHSGSIDKPASPCEHLFDPRQFLGNLFFGTKLKEKDEFIAALQEQLREYSSVIDIETEKAKILKEKFEESLKEKDEFIATIQEQLRKYSSVISNSRSSVNPSSIKGV